MAAILAELQTIKEAVVRAPAPAPAGVQSPYLTAEEAAAYCKLSVQTIYNNRRHITRQPGVGKLLFTRQALDD